MRYFIIFILILQIISCKKENNKILSNKEEVEFNDIFFIQDSIFLKYTKTTIPKRIYDISFDNQYFYVLGMNSKFPLVKFDRDGNLIKNISNVGPGPVEFNFIPQRMDYDKGKLAILIPNLSQLYLFENDNFLIKKYILTKTDTINGMKGISRPRDIQIQNDNILVFYSGGGSDYQIIEFDTNIEMKRKFLKLPKSNSITGLMLAEYWAVQNKNDTFITNIQYPPFIYKFNFSNNKLENLLIYNKLNFKYFNLLADNITIEKILTKSNKEKIKIYEAFSKLLWTIYKHNYIIGQYTTYINNKKRFFIFIIKDGQIILEKPIFPYYIIPVDNDLYLQKFISNSFNIKLYKIDINSKIIKN